MRLFSWWLVFNIYAMSLFSLFAQERVGRPYLTYYSVKDYEGYHQNWAVAENHEGYIFVANNNGILVYDATQWKMIQNPKRGTVRSLAVDRNNRVWVGAQGEFGWIDYQPDGQMVFRSLENRIPSPVKFDDIWKVHATDSMVYFRSKKYIFCWNGNEITVLKDSILFSNSFQVGNSVYVYQNEKGISLLKGDRLQWIPGSEVLKKKQIYFGIHYSGDSLLLGSQSEGLLVWYADSYRPLRTEADAFLKEKKMYCATRSPDGRIVIGTLHGGIVVLSKEGKLITSVGQAEGINSEKIHGMHIDRQGGLWTAMDNGISRISLFSPFTYWNNQSGIQGVVQDIFLDDQKAYVGTNLGFFELIQKQESGRLPYYAFRESPDLNTQVFKIIKIGDSFFLATRDGFFMVNNQLKKTLQPGAFFYIMRSRFDTTRILAGAKNGVLLLQYRNGQIQSQGMIKGINTEIRSIAETNDSTFWVGSRYEGIWSFRWNNKKPTEPVLTHYDTTHGLPTGYVVIYPVDDQVLFCGLESTHRFNAREGRFYPDTVFVPAVKRALGLSASFGLSDMYRLGQYIWCVVNNSIIGYFTQSNGQVLFESRAFRKIPKQTVINDVIHDTENVMWIGASDGVIQYRPDLLFYDTLTCITVIRSVLSINNDSLIPFVSYQESGKVYELPYIHNYIRINYSLLSFETEAENQFRVFLEGHDVQWSVWSRERYKEYMNLPEGNYIFRVQGRNLYGQEGVEAVFYFRILPPWYRTWWAYGLYFVIGVFILYSFVRWRVWVHSQRARELEKKVEERTRELIATQNQLIQSEKFSALGQLIGGIAHEINNPLSVASGNLVYFNEYAKTTILMMDEIEQLIYHLPDEIKNSLETKIHEIHNRYDYDYIREDLKQLAISSQHSVERIKKIIQDLRNLSSTDEQTPKKALVHECLEQALLSLQHFYRPSVRIHKNYKDKQPISCYPGLLTQALRHIILNAFQAITDEGEITLETEPARYHAEVGQGQKPVMIIRIKDTGGGIPVRFQNNIFDPFFTTKPVGKATGLGLSIAYQFIKRHEGVIHFISKEGKGTIFEIIIPAE